MLLCSDSFFNRHSYHTMLQTLYPFPIAYVFLKNSSLACVIFHNKMFIYGEELLAPHSTTKLKDYHLSAVATIYSVHLQLPSTSGSRLLQPHPE
jgi:hypothetical protein